VAVAMCKAMASTRALRWTCRGDWAWPEVRSGDGAGTIDNRAGSWPVSRLARSPLKWPVRRRVSSGGC